MTNIKCFVLNRLIYEDFIEQIMNLIESPKPLGILYRDTLKQFGRKDGLRIYREVKQII